MDVVYILGSGSLAGNAEIRYSLRALEQNMLDIGKVFVVGDNPDFLKNVIKIEARDEHREAWKNAYEKIMIACNDERVSDDFLLMNDDFFMTETFEGAEFPFHVLQHCDGGPSGMLAYTAHVPMKINKEMFSKMPFSVDMKGDMSPRSFYGNFYRAPAKTVKDFILRVGDKLPDIDTQLKGKTFFSISNQTMVEPEFVAWCATKWAKSEKYEKKGL